MVQTELQIANLLPTDGQVEWEGVNVYIASLRSGRAIEPIHALSFPEDESSNYVLLDGHHRAKAAHELGIAAIPANTYDTDESIAEFIRSERPWWRSVETRDDVRKLCGNWINNLARHGLVSISAIPEIVYEQRSWRRPDDVEAVQVDRAGNRIRR